MGTGQRKDEAHIQNDDDGVDDAEQPPISGNTNGDAVASTAELEAPRAETKNELEVVEQSGSQRAIENLLKVYYEPLELWFLRTSIEKVSRYPCHHSLTPGTPTRLPRYVVTTLPIFHSRRHVLPPQAGTQPGHVVRIAQHTSIDAGKAGHGCRE